MVITMLRRADYAAFSGNNENKTGKLKRSDIHVLLVVTPECLNLRFNSYGDTHPRVSMLTVHFLKNPI